MDEKSKPSGPFVPVNRAIAPDEFKPVSADTLSLFSKDTIEAELKLLRVMLDLPDDPLATDLDDDEWRDVIEDLMSGLGATSDEDITGYLRLYDEEDWQHAVAYGIDRAIRAVEYTRCMVDSDGGSTGLLLPSSYARRIEALLGRGILPVAWVRVIQVQKF
ncbi:MAG: hypothetical protein GOVbin2371_7 [Prokaryotic dsDNA virus sp.]|nr:hypothetical protein [Salipiger sp.]QDP47422.1 MAG: hypothetical protein GOVbin2371_7 [Prokaryotic dsDNA virus sp.]|tara:strand:+ start:1913 stop:2395 length:483 start_codon:yes stop_codon:yes gene_type:complete